MGEFLIIMGLVVFYNLFKIIFNKKIARSRRLSISGRCIVFFVKKLKKGYIHDKIFV